MSPLFLKTFSQGLQAFMPVAAALVWCRMAGATRARRALRWGVGLALPLSIPAALAFQGSARQAVVEAVLAWTAIAITLVIWPHLPRLHDSGRSRARAVSR